MAAALSSLAQGTHLSEKRPLSVVMERIEIECHLRRRFSQRRFHR